MLSPTGIDSELPVLIFFRDPTSGPSRRMENLVAWVRVTQKKKLRVVVLDAGENQVTLQRLGICTVPALVLVQNGRVVGRLEGRARGQQIEALIRPVVTS